MYTFQTLIRVKIDIYRAFQRILPETCVGRELLEVHFIDKAELTSPVAGYSYFALG